MSVHTSSVLLLLPLLIVQLVRRLVVDAHRTQSGEHVQSRMNESRLNRTDDGTESQSSLIEGRHPVQCTSSTSLTSMQDQGRLTVLQRRAITVRGHRWVPLCAVHIVSLLQHGTVRMSLHIESAPVCSMRAHLVTSMSASAAPVSLCVSE